MLDSPFQDTNKGARHENITDPSQKKREVFELGGSLSDQTMGASASKTAFTAGYYIVIGEKGRGRTDPIEVDTTKAIAILPGCYQVHANQIVKCNGGSQRAKAIPRSAIEIYQVGRKGDESAIKILFTLPHGRYEVNDEDCVSWYPLITEGNNSDHTKNKNQVETADSEEKQDRRKQEGKTFRQKQIDAACYASGLHEITKDGRKKQEEKPNPEKKQERQKEEENSSSEKKQEEKENSKKMQEENKNSKKKQEENKISEQKKEEKRFQEKLRAGGSNFKE